MKDCSIVVIIAAYNARDTIARAIQSALDATHVTEVFVVDDASDDDTAEIARLAGRGDDRLTVLVQSENKGPSAARNRAIAASSAPYIAILDSDDHLFPGRFERMADHTGWDLYADNLVFYSKPDDLIKFDDKNTNNLAEYFILDLEHFVLGNISVHGRVRGELGFLKPVVSRDFLTKTALLYDENCRFGEDFILYANALALGARFLVSNFCGYAALVRNNSLSSQHKLNDLAILREKCANLSASLTFTQSEADAMARHIRSLDRKIRHREVLQIKRDKGLVKGLLAAARTPLTFIDVLRDRISAPVHDVNTPRLLLNVENCAKYCK